VIPPQLSLYMALAPDEKISCAPLHDSPNPSRTEPRRATYDLRLVRSLVHRYKEGGPTAIANFEAGAEGFTTRAFRGCGVVTSDPFEVSDGKHMPFKP